MNGIWTSFLDHEKWGDYARPLNRSAAARLAGHMRAYDRKGLDTWIGEDFDARVLSLILTHHQQRRRSKGEGEPGSESSRSPMYSIIVEMPERLESDLISASKKMGLNALDWIQLGPPALSHLDELKRLQSSGIIRQYGVEDYSSGMLEQILAALPVVTVQQEINLIIRPSAASISLCEQHGCKFVAYGVLLGGLLSDRYLGARRPVPDSDHSKQRDYLDSIDQWGDWEGFQKMLEALAVVARRHNATISQVALSYTLDLPYMLGAIIGMRLGESDHSDENIRALQLKLTDKDKDDMVLAIGNGRYMGDGLSRT